jgi:RNA polymerase sigma factor (TIGR02999 family)
VDPEPKPAAIGPDATGPDRLFAALYDELHRLAEHHLVRGGVALTLSPTTLLHEAYLSIGKRRELAFPDHARFFAYASRAMRWLVIEYARRKRARRRGPEFEITLTGSGELAGAGPDADALARLGDALDELGSASPELAELVDLHFFCGFSLGEIAELRGVSERTAQRDWRKARLVLNQLLSDADPPAA